MDTHLFTVEEAFTVRDRVLVLTPGYQLDVDISPGNTVKLRRPDGSVITSVVSKAIEFGPHAYSDSKISELRRALILDLSTVKGDVPNGTDVYLISE